MSKGGTVFITDLQPLISTQTLSVGSLTTGTVMSGAIMTGNTQTATTTDFQVLFPVRDPDSDITGITIVGNATCGTINFSFKHVNPNTSFNIGFPSDFVYPYLPVVVTSAGNGAASVLVSTGGAYIISYKVPISDLIHLQINIPNEVTSATRQIATFNYVVCGTLP
jgi:hypothetical protein